MRGEPLLCLVLVQAQGNHVRSDKPHPLVPPKHLLQDHFCCGKRPVKLRDRGPTAQRRLGASRRGLLDGIERQVMLVEPHHVRGRQQYAVARLHLSSEVPAHFGEVVLGILGKREVVDRAVGHACKQHGAKQRACPATLTPCGSAARGHEQHECRGDQAHVPGVHVGGMDALDDVDFEHRYDHQGRQEPGFAWKRALQQGPDRPDNCHDAEQVVQPTDLGDVDAQPEAECIEQVGRHHAKRHEREVRAAAGALQDPALRHQADHQSAEEQGGCGQDGAAAAARPGEERSLPRARAGSGTTGSACRGAGQARPHSRQSKDGRACRGGLQTSAAANRW